MCRDPAGLMVHGKDFEKVKPAPLLTSAMKCLEGLLLQ